MADAPPAPVVFPEFVEPVLVAAVTVTLLLVAVLVAALVTAFVLLLAPFAVLAAVDVEPTVALAVAVEVRVALLDVVEPSVPETALALPSSFPEQAMAASTASEHMAGLPGPYRRVTLLMSHPSRSTATRRIIAR